MILEMLMRQEAFSASIYDDCGDSSIGFGRNLTQIGISRSEALVLLQNDINRVQKELEQFSWFEGLNEHRAAAITSMLYNLGLPRFKLFKLCIAGLESGDFDSAASEIYPNSKYAQQVPSRAREIASIIRRGTDADSPESS